MKLADYKTIAMVAAAIRGYFEHPNPLSPDLHRFGDESVGEAIFTLTIDHEFGRIVGDFLVDGEDACFDVTVHVEDGHSIHHNFWFKAREQD
jgi:hypothetical protein